LGAGATLPPGAGVEIAETFMPRATERIQEAKESIPRWQAKEEERERTRLSDQEMKRRERVELRGDRARREKREIELHDQEMAGVRAKRQEVINRQDEIQKRKDSIIRLVGPKNWDQIEAKGMITGMLRGMPPADIVKIIDSIPGLGGDIGDVTRWDEATVPERKKAVAEYLGTPQTAADHVQILESIGLYLEKADESIERNDHEVLGPEKSLLREGMKDAVKDVVRTLSPIAIAAVMDSVLSRGDKGAQFFEILLPAYNKVEDKEHKEAAKKILLDELGIGYRKKKQLHWSEDLGISIVGTVTGERPKNIWIEADPTKIVGKRGVYADPFLSSEGNILDDSVSRGIRSRTPAGPELGENILRQRASRILENLPVPQQMEFRRAFEALPDSGARMMFLGKFLASR